MAYVQGTATNFLDLFNKLRDFLTTNSTLVGAGENWSQLAGPTGTLGLDDSIVLVGPGSSGVDQIRVRIKPNYNVVQERYNLSFFGLPNWNSGLAQDAQFNSSEAKYIHLWNNSMGYVFIANGRHFKVIVRITTTVQAAYCGFGLPYSIPGEYVYPMAIGASSNTSSYLYSELSVEHSHFVNPSQSLTVFTPENTWINIRNFNASGNNISWAPTSYSGMTLPYACPSISDANSSAARSAFAILQKCFGGEYPMHPITILSRLPTKNRLMDLEGCFHIPGISNSDGSIISDVTGDYLVVQNAFRTDNFLGYWAARLA